MALLRDLVVEGNARFNSDAFFNVIKSGIWNGSTIDVAHGGTNVTGQVGNPKQPVYLSSNGLEECTMGTSYETFTSSNKTISGVTGASGDINVTKWLDTGIDLNGLVTNSTLLTTTHTYIVQLKAFNASDFSQVSIYSGIFSYYHATNDNTQYEIPLQQGGHDIQGNADYTNIYLAIDANGKFYIGHDSQVPFTINITVRAII